MTRMKLIFGITISLIILTSCLTGKRADKLIQERVSTTQDMVFQSPNTEWVSTADTLLFFIAYDIQSASVYGTLATREKIVSYIRNDDPIEYMDNSSYYTDFILDNLFAWDTLSVRKRELEQGAALVF
ncbi:MAG: hypothetical protein ACFCU6_14045 [Balneolaceae bacterium]